jgi:heptose I phosphotransferase
VTPLVRAGPVAEVHRVVGPAGEVRYEKRYSVAWPWIPLLGLLKANLPPLDARREAANAERLRALGIEAPRPLATGSRWRLRGAALVHESTVTLAEVPGIPLDLALVRELALDRSARRAAAASLGRLVATMHRASIFHRDLYLCHVLRDPASGRLGLIDAARATPRRLFRERWRAKDLGALAFSARGLATRGDLAAFLRAYLGTARLPAEARPIAARALEKARRLAEHGKKG